MLERVWGNIEKRRFSPLYLLYGNEPFLLMETYERLVNAALGPEEREWNLAVYDCEETPIEAALEEAETAPFFGERRVILIKHPYFFTSEKEKEIEHDLAKLEAYLKAPSPFSIVVFFAPYEKLDERKKNDEARQRAKRSRHRRPARRSGAAGLGAAPHREPRGASKRRGD
ncbi:DNA polymerase III, delta subunit [Geobacillus sp. WSUCF1]|nr:DNA polymerase III, delta subunit [Geobacillus sp. WSUCF1]